LIVRLGALEREVKGVVRDWVFHVSAALCVTNKPAVTPREDDRGQGHPRLAHDSSAELETLKNHDVSPIRCRGMSAGNDSASTVQ
jgi:hypothetical protein